MGNMHRELGKNTCWICVFSAQEWRSSSLLRVQRKFFSPPKESPTIELPERGEFANSFAKSFFAQNCKIHGFYLGKKCRISPCNRPLFSKVKGKYGKRREKGGLVAVVKKVSLPPTFLFLPPFPPPPKSEGACCCFCSLTQTNLKWCLLLRLQQTPRYPPKKIL